MIALFLRAALVNPARRDRQFRRSTVASAVRVSLSRLRSFLLRLLGGNDLQAFAGFSEFDTPILLPHLPHGEIERVADVDGERTILGLLLRPDECGLGHSSSLRLFAVGAGAASFLGVSDRVTDPVVRDAAPASSLIGQRFGRLVVERRAPKVSRQAQYECRCDCGNLTIVFGGTLPSGHTKSCGCLRVNFGLANARSEQANNQRHPGGTGRPIGSKASLCPAFTIARLEKKWSCFAVAAKLTEAGVPTSDSTPHLWENKGICPSEDRIDALAKIFCVPRAIVERWFGVEIVGSHR